MSADQVPAISPSQAADGDSDVEMTDVDDVDDVLDTGSSVLSSFLNLSTPTRSLPAPRPVDSSPERVHAQRPRSFMTLDSYYYDLPSASFWPFSFEYLDEAAFQSPADYLAQTSAGSISVFQDDNIKLTVKDGQLVVRLLGVGKDEKGLFRPPFKSCLHVFVYDNKIEPIQGTFLLMPTKGNRHLIRAAASILIAQKNTLYYRYRVQHKLGPIQTTTPRRQEPYHSTEFMIQTASAMLERPSSRLFDMMFVDQCVGLGKKVFGFMLLAYRLPDGEVKYLEVIGGHIYNHRITQFDVIFWECEEALAHLYFWNQALNEHDLKGALT